LGRALTFGAYEDVKKELDIALESVKGRRIIFDSATQATTWIARANQYRTLDRKRSCNVYPMAHPMYNRSAYDILSFRQRENKAELIKLDAIEYNTEEIE
jgi:hypothetical protein